MCKCCMCVILQVDYGRGTKAAGYYVQYLSGLFPAPLPQTDYDRMTEVETLFRCVGTLFAKCIQDGRLVDIPLSRPLLKLMCGGDLSDAVSHHRSCSSVSVSRSSDDDLTPTEPMAVPPVDPWFVSIQPKVFSVVFIFKKTCQNSDHYFYYYGINKYENTLQCCVSVLTSLFDDLNILSCNFGWEFSGGGTKTGLFVTCC